MKKIILALFLVTYAFNAKGAVHFMGNDDYLSFGGPKQSYNCPSGLNLIAGKCTKVYCSNTIYPFSSQPDASIGTVISCQSGNDKFYGYSSCLNGWTLNSGRCELNNCSGYPYTTSPLAAAGTIISCKSGASTFYAYSYCNSGWNLVSGRCEANTCDGYPLSSYPNTTIGTPGSSTCKSGSDTKYKYDSCKTGWDLNNGACEVHQCDRTIYLTTTCIANATCATCYTGGDVRYGSPACKTGYELSGGACVLKTACSGEMLSLEYYWCNGALQCILKK